MKISGSADYGLHNISAYVTVSEKRYKEFIENLSLTSPMMDIMNLKYLVLSKNEFEAEKGYFLSKYNPVYSSPAGTVVLENRTVLPKAWLVPSVMLVKDPQQRLIFMNSPYFKPESVAIVESNPSISLGLPGEGVSVGTATVESYEANRIVVNASVRQNALLVTGEKYYRWWFAKVDGVKRDIYPVDHILRGVYLTPGVHRIEFYFDPLTFKIGKYLTLSSFAFFAVIAGRELWTRRKRNKRCSTVKR